MIRQDGDDVLLDIKAVPGASRDAIAGPLGDRLKVRVSAAPEGGQANKAICLLIARAVGARPKHVAVASGHGRPEKTLRIVNTSIDRVRRQLQPL